MGARRVEAVVGLAVEGVVGSSCPSRLPGAELSALTSEHQSEEVGPCPNNHAL